MSKIKVNEASGIVLDYLVAKASGVPTSLWHGFLYPDPEGKFDPTVSWTPSTKWAQSGPIIEREKISTRYIGKTINGPLWDAAYLEPEDFLCEGSTLLVAAMRCYVAKRLGDEVEVPAGLRS